MTEEQTVTNGVDAQPKPKGIAGWLIIPAIGLVLAPIRSSRETAGLSIARYKQGLVTFLEVIDAERSRLDAELEAAQILSQKLIATVQLIKALGGSWSKG